MNEYIFYTCEGYTYSPKEEKEIENCQIIGRAEGKNVAEAQHVLLEANPWIEEYGFDISKAIHKQLLTDENKKDIKTIVDCFLANAFKHYQECNEPQDHIYLALKRLQELVC